MSTKRNIIVAAVDDTAAADDVVRAALATARGFGTSEIHFVHVAEPPLSDAGQLVRLTDQMTEGRAILARVTAAAAEHFAGPIESHLVVDLACAGILQVATDLEADLIVVGSHGRGYLQRLVHGSAGRTILNRAHCAVLVARPPTYPSHAPALQPEPAR